MDARVRLAGSVAVLTGESQTIAERQGVVSEYHFRLIAIYVEAEGKRTPSAFPEYGHIHTVEVAGSNPAAPTINR